MSCMSFWTEGWLVAQRFSKIPASFKTRGAAQMAAIFLLRLSIFFSSWATRASFLRLSVPGCPPGKTTMSNSFCRTFASKSSGKTLIPLEPFKGPSSVPARVTWAPARLRISTTVIVSISSNPGARGTKTVFINGLHNKNYLHFFVVIL